MRRSFLFVLLISACSFGQTPTADKPRTPDANADKKPSEPGIPVKSELVQAKCGGCHKPDAANNLTRISWERTTPEGWQQIIKRMIRLNGLVVTAEEARDIVQTLSESHGLAPEEAKPVAWYWEKRHVQSEKFPSDAIRDTCAACHPVAQPLSWRRSREEWELLVAMHRGYYPVVENTSFRRPTPPNPVGSVQATSGAGGAAAGPAARAAATPSEPSTGDTSASRQEPTQIAIDEFTKSNPLHSPEWASWQAGRREPKFGGRWLVSAYLPGKGRYTGEMTIQPAASGFSTKTTLTSLKTGEKISREGKGVVYTGYAWRGRSAAGKQEEREVMSFSRDQQSAEGRWYWGGYNEFGYDVTLRRAGDGPLLSSLDTLAAKTGSTAITVKIFGDQLPAGLKPEDIDFGGGVKVTSIAAQSANSVAVKIDVDAAAVPGKRDVSIRRFSLPGAFAIYNKIDYIKTPESAVARLGGNSHPKGYYQFEAVAWSNGLDDKPRTGDDIELGPVDAKWSIEEFPAHLGDDDIEFVGSLGAEGLFTPNVEGPNEQRRFGTNNYGDVWINAAYTPPGTDKPLVAKSYLVVSVPLYIRWDQQPESGR